MKTPPIKIEGEFWVKIGDTFTKIGTATIPVNVHVDPGETIDVAKTFTHRWTP